MTDKEQITKILSKIKDTVGENNYKLALAITGHRTGKIKDIIMCSKDGELLLEYVEHLEQQTQKQKEIIDKAVEYIKEEKKEEGFHNYLDDEDMEELLQILEDKRGARMKIDNYYQSNIKTSRQEDGVYAMKYASQQMLIDKLQQENQQLRIQISAMEENYRKLDKENFQLKLINKEYERLNKENGRGFKITSVKQYNIDELLKYKNNWNELKEYIKQEPISYFYNDKLPFEVIMVKIITKMQELEDAVSDVED